MNKLNAVTLGLALAGTAVILNLVCAVTVALWPDQMIAVVNSWTHGIDLKAIKAPALPGAASLFYGLISVGIVGFVVGAVFAWLYNFLGARPRS